MAGTPPDGGFSCPDDDDFDEIESDDFVIQRVEAIDEIESGANSQERRPSAMEDIESSETEWTFSQTRKTSIEDIEAPEEERQHVHLQESIDDVDDGFFDQRKAVCEFQNDESANLDLWSFGFTRVLKVSIAVSTIDGLSTDEPVRLIVRSDDVKRVREQGDRFIMVEPFRAFAHDEDVYIIAPNVSDKC